jgi:WD40 repeat protein
VRVSTANRKPIRGAILAEEGSTVRLALQRAPTEADPSNVTIFKLGEGDGEEVLRFAAGKGEIQRLAASRQTRRLATIGCTRPTQADDCSKDAYEVNVWQFSDRMDAPTRIVSLASPDFIRSDFQGRVPLRVVLSPDGQWLVISFSVADQNAPQPLFVLRLDNPGNGMWIPSNLRRVREIAFSEDSKMFAAGGCCGAERGVDQIYLWSVDKSGFKSNKWALPLTPFARVVQDIAFATDPKGRPVLLIGGRFGTISRWDLGPEQALEWRVDTHGVSFVAFSRDESVVATASSQGVVRLWDMTRWPPFELTPQADDPGAPGFLGFAANGARLVSSADKVDVWDLDPASLQRKICALLRAVGSNGVDGDTPWHADKECKRVP